MSAIVVRNISEETHRALRRQAKQNRRSTEAEVRAILDGAVRPARRFRLGSALARLAKPLGGIDLETRRDKTPVEAADLS